MSCLLASFASSALTTTMNTLRFQHLTAEDGLSGISVGIKGNAMLQDRFGFLWFGTRHGLNRFDGSDFTSFLNDPSDPNSLSDNQTLALFEDDSGYLWVGTQNGLNRFDPKTEKFERFLPKFANADFRDIAEGEPGYLWLGTMHDGLIHLEVATGEYKQYQHNADDPKSLSHNSVEEVLKDKDGVLWLGTSNGLNRFDSKTSHFQRFFYQKGQSDSISNNSIRALYDDPNGALWIGTVDGLNRFNKTTKTFTRYLSSSTSQQSPIYGGISNVISDHLGNLWVAIYSAGLCQLDVTAGRCQRFFSHDRAESTSLKDNNINQLFQDRDNTIWVGTLTGLSYFRLNQQAFHFKPYLREINGIVNQYSLYTMLYDSKDRLWLGTLHGGLGCYGCTSHEISYFFYDKSNPTSISNNVVSSIIEDQEGTIWVATYGGGLNRYDPRNHQFIRYPASPRRITELYQDKHGRVWVGTQNGLMQFDPSTGVFTDKSELFSINRSIHEVFEDQRGELWVGSSHGLWQIRPDGSFVTHLGNSEQQGTLQGNFINSIYEDSQQRLWIGTDKGLNLFDRKQQGFTNHKMNGGLPLDMVFDVAEDKAGKLWVVTAGLSHFDPQTGQVLNYKKSDGLISGFTNGAHAITPQGEFLFGGSDGLIRFFPDQVVPDTKKPAIIFSGLKLFNKTVPLFDPKDQNDNDYYVLPKPIHLLEELQLSHRENSFTINYAAFNARHPRKIRYAHRLIGWDEDWINTSFEDRVAQYTNVPAGDYQLAIRAADPDSAWQETEGYLPITIAAPWWQTIWAYSLFAIGVIASVLLLLRIRTNYLIKKNLQLEDLVTDRTREITAQKEIIEDLLVRKDQLFANVSHEFRTPLTLIAGPVNKALQTFDKKQAQAILAPVLINTKRLQRMVDQLLDLARLDNQSEEQSAQSNLSDILTKMHFSMRTLFEERALTVNFNVTPALWLKASPDVLEKIVINLLSNAVKYTPQDGQITIEAKPVEQEIQLTISDTGVGIAPADHQKVFERFTRLDNSIDSGIPGAGIGLALVKQLVTGLNGHIELHSELNEGTTFVVLFPCLDVVEGTKSNADLAAQSSIVEEEIELLASPITEPLPIDNNEVIQDRPKLLIVEDHPEMRDFIDQSLRKVFDCHHAEDGNKGVEKALAIIPDLIITDLMMPKKDGFEMSQIIRRDVRTSHIPLIMLTAKQDTQSRMQAWKSAIDDYIEKPFDANELVLRCQNLISIRSLLSQRLSQGLNAPSHNASHNASHIDWSLLNEKDRKFIEKLEQIIAENYADSSLGVRTVIDELAMSDSQLQRKMKALLNQTPSEYLRNFRLKKGAELLSKGHSVTNVAFEVGFSSSSYFSNCFKVYYGVAPKTYQQKAK